MSCWNGTSQGYILLVFIAAYSEEQMNDLYYDVEKQVI